MPWRRQKRRFKMRTGNLSLLSRGRRQYVWEHAPEETYPLVVGNNRVVDFVKVSNA
jgi:hypothetical protein